MKKLTDEQISRVLSQNETGQLRHESWGSTTWNGTDCGCVAGVALELPDGTWDPPESAIRISKAVRVAALVDRDWGDVKYPSDPDEMLQLLEKAGLA